MFGNLSPSKVFKTYISMFEFLEFDPLNASVYAKQHVWTFLAQEQAAYRERRDGSCVFLKDLEG